MMTGIPVITGFIISVITARSLGPEGKGEYVLALLLINTVSFVLNPGIYTSANYFISSHRLTKQEGFSAALALSIPFSLVAAAIVLITYLVITRDEAPPDPLRMSGLFIAVGTSAALLSTSMNGVLFGSKKVRAISIWSILSATIQMITAFAIVSVGRGTVAVFIGMYAMMQVLDAAAKTSIAFLASGRGFAIRLELLRSFLQYGLTVHGSRVLLMLAQRVDTYMVVLLAGALALGFYSVSATFADQLLLLPMAVSLVMMTNIAHLDKAESARVTSEASKSVISLAILAAISLAVVGGALIIFFYGPEFAPSIPPFLIMLPGIVAFSIYPILEPYFQSRGLPWIPVRLSLLGLIINLLLGLLLIPTVGIIGAAIAYSVSYLIQAAVTCLVFSRVTGISVKDVVNPTVYWKKGMTHLLNKLNRVGKPLPAKVD